MKCLIMIITKISEFYIPFITSCLFTFSVVLFYLDDLRLSNNKVIKLLQIFSFVGMFLMLIYLAYYNTILTDIICYAKDSNDTNSNMHGNITLNKDTGKAIGQGLSTMGSQIGMGLTMAGIATSVQKAVAKSSMPPLQKAGLIIGASVLGGFGNTRIAYINKNNSNITIENTISNTNNSSCTNKLVDN